MPWSLLQETLAALLGMRDSVREEPREKRDNGGEAVSGFENFDFLEQLEIRAIEGVNLPNAVAKHGGN